jgi:hypothetical protein
LVLGRTSDNVITKYIGEESEIDGVQVEFDQLTVAGFKKLLLHEELLGGITNMDLWKVDGKKVNEEENNLNEFTESDIKEKLGGEKMIPRFPLEDYFKSKEIDIRDIHVFIVSTSTGKCLPMFYLLNKKFAVTKHRFGLISFFSR